MLRNCVKVARLTLTQFVRVRILLPQPRRRKLRYFKKPAGKRAFSYASFSAPSSQKVTLRISYVLASANMTLICLLSIFGSSCARHRRLESQHSPAPLYLLLPKKSRCASTNGL